MEEIEIWKDIGGYDGLYQISNLGNVKSLYFHSTRNPSLLRQENMRYGYKRVTLSKDGETKRFSVHRLVALAFIPNPDNYPCINHKDENPSNNRSENLEWCTVQYNTNYGSGMRKMVETRNLNNGRYRELPIEQISSDGESLNCYRSLHEAARATGICLSSICFALRGRYKTAGGYLWRYTKRGEG